MVRAGGIRVVGFRDDKNRHRNQMALPNSLCSQHLERLGDRRLFVVERIQKVPRARSNAAERSSTEPARLPTENAT